MLLNGKRIIVTGGVTGIGKATVLACVREGAKVVSMSRAAPNSPNAEATIKAARALGSGNVVHMQLDISKREDVDRVFDEAAAFLGGLDAMVNVAGNEQTKPAEQLQPEDFLSMYSVHVLGTANTNTAALRHMKDAGGGSIVNTASYAGVSGMPNMAAYSAAKGAVLAYTRCVAKEWGPYKVRVNVVCPTAKTELYYEMCAQMTAEQLSQLESYLQLAVPLRGDLGTVEECADMNLFLASDLSTFVTGQTLAVDGGLMMTR